MHDRQVWLDHRVFLPEDHAYRKKGTYEGMFEFKDDQPKRRPLRKSKDCFERNGGQAEINKVMAENKDTWDPVFGSIGLPVLYPLLMYDASKDSPLDIMHLVRNIAYHICQLLMGNRSKLYKARKLKPRKGEKPEEYAERVRLQEELFEEKNQRARSMNDSMKKFHITSAQQDEVDRRFRRVKAPRGMKGKGLPFSSSSAMTAAEWFFFARYCAPWIFDDILEGAALVVVKKLFRIASKFLEYEVCFHYINLELQSYN